MDKIRLVKLKSFKSILSAAIKYLTKKQGGGSNAQIGGTTCGGVGFFFIIIIIICCIIASPCLVALDPALPPAPCEPIQLAFILFGGFIQLFVCMLCDDINCPN